MRMPRIGLAFLSLAFIGCAATASLLAGEPSAVPKPLKQVTLFLEGDSSTVPKLINIFRQKGPEYGLDFKFAGKKDDAYDYRLILSSEGSGVWNFAHGNVVVMNQEGKLIFTVTRSNRLTGKGAVSALAKEVVKLLARYSGTHS
jgi:hypothetical protein